MLWSESMCRLYFALLNFGWSLVAVPSSIILFFLLIYKKQFVIVVVV